MSEDTRPYDLIVVIHDLLARLRKERKGGRNAALNAQRHLMRRHPETIKDKDLPSRLSGVWREGFDAGWNAALESVAARFDFDPTTPNPQPPTPNPT